VTFGQQRHHQSWIQHDFLSTTASENLVSDLVRYIVINYHPSNEVGFIVVVVVAVCMCAVDCIRVFLVV